jgi:AhpC/TSA family
MPQSRGGGGSPQSLVPIFGWRWQNHLMLMPGQPAPGFAMPDQHGDIVDLADLRGGWVLLWWYPKAATPG